MIPLINGMAQVVVFHQKYLLAFDFTTNIMYQSGITIDPNPDPHSTIRANPLVECRSAFFLVRLEPISFRSFLSWNVLRSFNSYFCHEFSNSPVRNRPLTP